METANGIIHTNRFDVDLMTALGIQKQNFEVTSYLFDDPESTFRGVIGLDFLAGTKFCIDLVDCEITIQTKG